MTEARRVALFVTCLVDQVLPEVGVATVRLLRRAGFKVEFPVAQTCCGQPFHNSGHTSEAVRLAKRTVEILGDYPTVVLPSGSCAAMIRVEYPHLLEPWPDWHSRAQALAAKTFELSEFLVEQAGWMPVRAASAPAVTYHDSCHMCRMLQLGAEPRKLLAASGHRVNEMRESDRCCGFGGLFSLRMPEVSNAMTTEKVAQANETGAPILASADPGCIIQMRGLAPEDGLQIEHIATLLEAASR